LGQRASAHKKNEIRDIPKLLDSLYLKGAIITTDDQAASPAQNSTRPEVPEIDFHHFWDTNKSGDHIDWFCDHRSVGLNFCISSYLQCQIRNL
jgi:predicted transposase YbfD/YdcC